MGDCGGGDGWAGGRYWHYAAARLLSGYASGGWGIAAFVLANEFVGPSYRSTTGTLSQVYRILNLPLRSWTHDGTRATRARQA